MGRKELKVIKISAKKAKALIEEWSANLNWKELKLSEQEMETLKKFAGEHGKCPPAEGVGSNILSVTINYGTIGSYVVVKCDRCGKELDISDEKRSNW